MLGRVLSSEISQGSLMLDPNGVLGSHSCAWLESGTLQRILPAGTEAPIPYVRRAQGV